MDHQMVRPILDLDPAGAQAVRDGGQTSLS
jgi:hypothetical protein